MGSTGRIARRGPSMRQRLNLLIASVVVALCLGRGAAGGAKENATYPIWWSPSLELESLDKIDERLARKFRPKSKKGLPVYKGKPPDVTEAFIYSCVSYDKLRKEGYYARYNRPEQVLLYYYSFCATFEMLRTAKPSRISFVNDVTLSPDIVDYLPAMVNPGVSCDMLCRQYAANELRVPWSSFEVEKFESIDVVGPYLMRVQTRSEIISLEILARADFNEDGLEDLLIRIDAGATEGTWGTTKLYTLTRDTPDGVLWMLDAERHICPAESYTCK